MYNFQNKEKKSQLSVKELDEKLEKHTGSHRLSIAVFDVVSSSVDLQDRRKA